MHLHSNSSSEMQMEVAVSWYTGRWGEVVGKLKFACHLPNILLLPWSSALWGCCALLGLHSAPETVWSFGVLKAQQKGTCSDLWMKEGTSLSQGQLLPFSDTPKRCTLTTAGRARPLRRPLYSHQQLGEGPGEAARVIALQQACGCHWWCPVVTLVPVALKDLLPTPSGFLRCLDRVQEAGEEASARLMGDSRADTLSPQWLPWGGAVSLRLSSLLLSSTRGQGRMVVRIGHFCWWGWRFPSCTLCRRLGAPREVQTSVTAGLSLLFFLPVSGDSGQTAPIGDAPVFCMPHMEPALQY